MLEAGLPPAEAINMLTTCFLAALFHGIVILGVTFRAQNKDAGGPDAPLEVVLVNDRAPKAATNPNARYVAQHPESGSGNSLEHRANPDSTLLSGGHGSGRCSGRRGSRLLAENAAGRWRR